MKKLRWASGETLKPSTRWAQEQNNLRWENLPLSGGMVVGFWSGHRGGSRDRSVRDEEYTIFGDHGHPGRGEDKGASEGDRGGGPTGQADP